MSYFWFLLCWWFSYTWNKICCISGISHLISDHVYDSVSTCLYIIDRKYLHGFSASDFGRTLQPCHVWELSKTILAHLAIQATSARCCLAKQMRKFTILFSNSHKWRPALQCKRCDLVKWNNKTEQWHFVDILYTRPINGMVKVLFKVHFKWLVQGSAILARSAMNGSITSGSNDGKSPPHTSNRTCFTAWSHMGHATTASQHTAHWCWRSLLAGTDRQPWDFCIAASTESRQGGKIFCKCDLCIMTLPQGQKENSK